MRLSIIIPTCTADLVKPCLESILRSTSLRDAEIIIVANGAAQPLRPYLDGMEAAGVPVRCLWHDAPIGATKALNEGIKEATGDYVILLNDDTILLKQPRDRWVNMLLEPFVDRGVGITGALKTRDAGIGVEFILFFCAMIPRRLFDEVGMLDEECNPGSGEDLDFAVRAKQKGYRAVQVPDDLLDGNIDPKVWLGNFPIYHKGEGTVHVLPGVKEDWANTFNRNFDRLRRKYAWPEREIEWSVVIPTCTLPFLQRLVPSILGHTDMLGGEVIVVANGAQYETRGFVISLGEPFRLVWHDEKIGATRALNEGIKAARGKYIVLLNDDAKILGRSWLPMLLDPLRKGEAEMTGPVLGYASDIDEHFILMFCAAVKREMFDKLGVLDETFNPGGFEDMDFGMKMKAIGGRLLQVPGGDMSVRNGLLLGGFPIFHEEHHEDWMTQETKTRNRKIIQERYAPGLIPVDWPVAQKPPELFRLQRWMAQRGGDIRRVLEVGTYRGGSAALWAKMAARHEGGLVVCVDTRFDWGGFEDFFLGHPLWVPGQVYRHFPEGKLVVEIEGDSHDEGTRARVEGAAGGGSFDLLFIDGDHAYEGVKRDFELFAPMVRPGGFIALHDVIDTPYHREKGVFVKQFWDEIKDKYEHAEFRDFHAYPNCPLDAMGIGVLRVSEGF